MSHERGLEFLRILPRLTRDLPFSPKLLSTLAAQLAGEGTDFSRIAASISQDQGLTACMLKLANSAYYGLESKVTSVQRAIVVLGLREIRSIILALAAGSLFRRGKPAPGFNIESYWTHQVRVAQLARALTRVQRAPGLFLDPDALYTAGMLHDVGKLIVAVHAPEDYAAIQETASELMLPWDKAEDRHWGLDHGVIGALVLRTWSLPAELSEPVNWHHSPEATPDYREASALLALADSLVHGMESPEAPAPADPASLSASLGMAEASLQAPLREIMGDESALIYAHDLATLGEVR